MKYSVQYELEVQPTNVTVEIVCKDKKDQDEVYLDRLGNYNCKNLKKLEKEE